MNQKLPGISAEYARRAQLQQVDATTAFKLCGGRGGGLAIPYHDMYGEPVEDGDQPFVRLRLDEPIGDQKYHQRAGSRVHAYVPPSIWLDRKFENVLVVVEGEKKALALTECGFCAIGIGGFYGYAAGGEIAAELRDVISHSRPEIIVFVGDQDALFNLQFSDAAVKFAKMVPNIHHVTVCVPIDAPGKGVDDVREALGTGFYDWWTRHQFFGEVLTSECKPAELALALLEPQLKILGGPQGDDLLGKIAKLAAGLLSYPFEHERLIELAEQHSGRGRALVKRFFKQVAKERAAAASTHALGFDSENVIDLAQPAALWTKRLLEIIGRATYLHGGNLCDLIDGRFVPHTPASLIPFCDDPQQCQFIQTPPYGSVRKAQFTEAHARIVIGALRQNLEVLRTVEVLSSVPVLAWAAGTVHVVEGYNKDLRILAGFGHADLPTPEAAAQRLLDALVDFDFPTEGDAGRAVAFLLTPALAMGRFLDSGRAPFFMVEKDQCGAGGGTLVRLGAAIYDLKPASITPDQPKSAKEDVSKHLLSGANFIYLDNIRGRILSHLEFLESLLTEPAFICRAPYSHSEVNVERCVVACTSNGAVLSRDLADRMVKISIRKRPDGYRFRNWPNGSLLDHVQADRLHYLGAIYSLVRAWADAGRPEGTGVTGFRFGRWEAACSWILEHFFPGLTLLDAKHKQAQQRISNPDFDLLRTVFRLAMERGNYQVKASTLAEYAIEIRLLEVDGKAADLQMGRLLKKEFPTEGEFSFAGEFLVRRSDITVPEQNYEKVKQYYIQPLSNGRKQPQAMPATPISNHQPVSA